MLVLWRNFRVSSVFIPSLYLFFQLIFMLIKVFAIFGSGCFGDDRLPRIFILVILSVFVIELRVELNSLSDC